MAIVEAFLQGRVRRLGLAAAFVGAALFFAPDGVFPEAAAKGRSSRGNRKGAHSLRSDLSPGPGAAGTEASGWIQFKWNRRGERLKLKLDNLEPRTEYEVRAAASGDVLGTVRTNRRGRGKKTLRSREEAFGGLALEVCETGSDEPILEGTVPDDGNSEPPWFDGKFRVGTVSTEPGAAAYVSITLSSMAVPDMEGTYDSISLFVGPGDFWIQPAGMEVGSGNGEDGGQDDDGDHDDGGDGNDGDGNDDDGNDGDGHDDDGNGDHPSIPGPVTFWITDGEGELHLVATVVKQDWTDPMPLPEPGRDPGTGDGGNGVGDRPDRKGHHRRGGLAFPEAGWRDGGQDDGGDGGGGGGLIFPMPDSYSWYADNSTEEGLPLGVGSVEDLSGRAFEVRDGEGIVLLEGVLPELEEIVREPLPIPEPGPCPWTGIDIHVEIDIRIDLGGIDWGSIDWGSIDWGGLDLGHGGDGWSFPMMQMR